MTSPATSKPMEIPDLSQYLKPAKKRPVASAASPSTGDQAVVSPEGSRTPTADSAGPGAKDPASADEVRQAEDTSPQAAELISPAPLKTPARDNGGGEAQAAGRSRSRVYLRSISLLIPRSLHGRLADAAETEGISNTAFLLNALNKSHTHLAVAIAERRFDAGDLFDVPQTSRGTKEPTVATSIKVTDHQFEVINRLCRLYNITRVELFVTTLEVYFGLRVA